MQSQPITVGSYVQVNTSMDSPRSMAPSAIEESVGIVRQVIAAKGESFYQVLWAPGTDGQRIALYRASELTPIDQKTATQILSELQAGTFQPSQQTPGSATQPSNLPEQALPPGLQGEGTFAPNTATTSPPTLQQTGLEQP